MPSAKSGSEIHAHVHLRNFTVTQITYNRMRERRGEGGASDSYFILRSCSSRLLKNYHVAPISEFDADVAVDVLVQRLREGRQRTLEVHADLRGCDVDTVRGPVRRRIGLGSRHM